MSDLFAFESRTSNQRPATTLAERNRQHYLKRHLLWGCGFILVFAALPMASNRPVFWLVWVAIISFLMIYYLVRSPVNARIFSCLKQQKILILAAAILPLMAFIQGFSEFSVSPDVSLSSAIRLSGYLIFFTLILEISTKMQNAQVLLWIIFLAAIVHAIWAIASLSILDDMGLWGEKTAYVGAATGTFVNRNAFAMFLGMGLVTGIPLVLSRSTRSSPLSAKGIERLCLWICLGIITLCIIATQSRMGILSTCLACIVCVFSLQKDKTLKNALIPAGITVGAIILMLLFWGEDVVQRFVFLQIDHLDRAAFYEQMIQMIALRPYTGFGADNFRLAYEMFQAPPVTADLVWEYGHSSYLTNWLEFGLIIGSIPIVLGVTFLYRFIKDHRKSASPLAILVLCGLHSTVDFGLEIPANMFVFLALVAIGLAGLDQKRASQ